jgi:hypothetical protein
MIIVDDAKKIVKYNRKILEMESARDAIYKVYRTSGEGAVEVLNKTVDEETKKQNERNGGIQ